jgi:hypothetical protein
MFRSLRLLILAICLLPAVLGQSQHLFFCVNVSSAIGAPVSGRLLVFLAPGTETGDINQSPFDPESAWVAAKEIHDVQPGSFVEIDTDDIAYPKGFSQTKPGNYRAQALVDVDHSYNYFGRDPGDVVTDTISLPDFDPAKAAVPVLTLSKVIPPAKLVPLSSGIKEEDFVSPVLSRFYARPIHMRALVVPPPHYTDHPERRYPAGYYTQGFGGSLDRSRGAANLFASQMDHGKMPEMFWILLDESLPTGTHEFADSVNNGPWGHALTTEFIPYLERRYRLDARPGARLLNGHSSGGWATMWLQVRYPRIFGGTWSTSPDPVDFHDFTGVDLYAPNANMYHCAQGPCPLVRDRGKVLATLEQFSHLEATLGPYGGQFASFEWVFSPRGPDGRPVPMFDRTNGNVNADVVQHWQQYDIANIIRTHWKQLAPSLNGKIHIYVGTADTFYLDGAVHRLDSLLRSLGANAKVQFLEGRTHMNLYDLGNDPHGLLNQIAAEMYTAWKSTAAPTGPK